MKDGTAKLGFLYYYFIINYKHILLFYLLKIENDKNVKILTR